MQGKKKFREKLFTHFQLSDRVPADNFYRRLKNVLNLQWLYKATQKYYGTEGQQSIDPVVFMKLRLIGYLENLGSDRRIINTVSMRMDMLFFIGYDIDEPLPWHSTLSRTRQLYGEELFKQFFEEVLKQCIDKGMVAGRRQVMDSVAVKAYAGMDSLIEKEILDDSSAYADELKNEEEQSEDDKENKTACATRYKAVELHHQWKAKAYKDMPRGKSLKGDERGRPKFVSNHTHYSTTDPDARVSVKPGKPRQLNYTAQVSVDTAHHVITQIQTDYADKKDSQYLPSLVNNTIDNLQQEGLQIEEVYADAGYSSGEALKSLEENNIIGYIPNFGQYKPSREGFLYDKENDRYVCSQGKYLPFKKLITTSLGYKMKVYRSSAKDCGPCPLRGVCIGKSDLKKIDDTVDKHLYDRMHVRLQSVNREKIRQLRSSTVEPVLGTLVNLLAMRRVKTRGIKQAAKCILMSAIAYNLKKLLKWEQRKINTAVIAMKKAEKSLCIYFLMLWRSVNVNKTPKPNLIIA
ncbi:MAG TPA: IS1182 family transposase [Chitinophagaceae bacterium]|nr:IS1182 family transposase [Chitinophagaceae bacterium]